MFRKRIATFGIFAISTLAASLASPRLASAQVIDMDEDEGDGVIDLDAKGGGKGVIDLDEPGAGQSGGVAAVAGAPTETMKSAKQAFDEKRWGDAAQGMHSVVSGASGDDAGNQQLAEFYLGQSLYQLKFFQGSFDSFTKIAANPKHLKFAETLLWLAKLATDLPEPADIISSVGKYGDEQLARFDNKAQQKLYWTLNYLLGRHKYRQGQHQEAIRLFQRVGTGSENYVHAQFFTGVSYIQLRKAVAAVKAFQRVETAVNEGAPVEDADRMRDLANPDPNLTVGARPEHAAEFQQRFALPVVERLNEDLLHPAGLKMELSNDDVRYVENSVRNVIQNILIGILLTTVVMFLFLRSASTTFIAMSGMPLCIVAGFIGLLLLDRTINVISLAGIAFAIGMTVDNTIVVLESIEIERQKGKSRFEAARDGTRAVWSAVLSGTMTTVLVFLPLLFVKEEAGQLFSDIGIAISASILVSMLVATTVVPVAYANLPTWFRPRQPRQLKPPRLLVPLTWMLSTAPRRFACLFLTFLTAFAIFTYFVPPAEYLPEGEEAKAFSTMIAPPGYSLKEMDRIALELQEELLPALEEDHPPLESGNQHRFVSPYMNQHCIAVRQQRCQVWLGQPLVEEALNHHTVAGSQQLQRSRHHLSVRRQTELA